MQYADRVNIINSELRRIYVKMSQNQQKLPFIPDLEPILPKASGNRDGAVIDSLRFSYDYDNTLEYSEDGRQIDFEFEDLLEYPEYTFQGKHQSHMVLPQDINKSQNKSIEDRNQTMDQSTVNRRLEIFQKYRNKNKQKETSAKNQPTDIVDSFDRIFNMKGNEVNHSTSLLFKKKNNEQASSETPISQQQSQSQPAQVQGGNNNILGTLTQSKLGQVKKAEDKKQIISNTNVNPNQFSPVSVVKNNSDPVVTEVKNQSSSKYAYNYNDGNNHVLQASNNQAPKYSGSTASNTSNNTAAFIIQPNTISRPSIDNTLNPIPSPIQPPIAKVYFDYSQANNDQNRSYSEPLNQLSISNVSATVNNNDVINNTSINITNLQLGPVLPVNLSSSPSVQAQNVKLKTYSDPVIPLSFVKGNSMGEVYDVGDINIGGSRGHSEKNIGVDNNNSNMNFTLNANTNVGGINPGAWLAHPLFEEENRIAPIFRKIHKMNSIYPNFNHPSINLEQQQKFTNILATVFLQAFVILQSLALKALDRLRQPKYYPTQFSSLSYFLNSGWQQQHYKEWQLMNMTIKPQSNFPVNNINDKKLRDALVNYKQVIMYYKQRKVELNSQENIQSYFRIRHKFWSLQRNMRSISQDIYRLYQENQYPFFYYDYLNVLRSPLPSKNDEKTIGYHQNVLRILIINKQRNQPLSSSQVGMAVKNKLQRELKFLFPF